MYTKQKRNTLKIENMRKGDWGKLKAFFDVKTEEGFVIKSFKLVEGINGFFVGNPSHKGKDDEYFDTIFAERELKDELSQLAIDHYGQEIMPADDTFENSSSTANDTAAETSDNTPIEKSDTPTFTDDDIPF